MANSALRAFALASGFVLAAACSQPEAPAPAADGPRDIAGFAHPESVLIAGDRRFVSNVGAVMAPAEHDGDGFISALEAAGAVVELRFIEGLDAPKGMAVIGDTLYVTDIDKVAGFNIATKERVFAADYQSDNPFLNDLAALDDDALLVTDTFAGALLRLSLADGAFTQIAEGVPGANGIAVSADGAHALVVGMGPDFSGDGLYRVALADGAVARLGEAKGMFDGVALMADGDFVVSDWVAQDGAGALRIYQPDGALRRELALAAQHGPADFAYDAAGAELWIPWMLDGVVSVAPLAAAEAP